MDEKTRETLMDSLEDAMLAVGVESYEKGIKTLERLIECMSKVLNIMRTRDDLRKFLDGMKLSWADRRIALFATRHLPHIFRWIFRKMAQDATNTLPALESGRPRALNAKQAREIVEYICKLLQTMRLEAAKQRTANKYGCSLRTIERYWTERTEPIEDNPDIDEISAWLIKG